VGLTKYELWHGRKESPEPLQVVRAGNIELLLGPGEARYLRVGTAEVLRRVYSAVRDAAWGTAPAAIKDVALDVSDDTFTSMCDASYRLGEIEVSARIEIVGSADGRIEYTFKGLTRRRFRYSRIGICLLHPLSTSAGRPFHSVGPEGAHEGALPELIAPPLVQDGVDLPLFPSFATLDIDLGQGLRLELSCSGDLFEMEDQRNWTDGSLKTFSTPLALGWPRDIEAGATIEQSVTIVVAGAARRRRTKPPTRLAEITVAEVPGRRMPPIGLGLSEDALAPIPRERSLLTELRPAHLRFDVRVNRAADFIGLETAISLAQSLESALELALHLGENAEAGLDRLAAVLGRSGASIPRVLVFRDGELCTSGRWIALGRSRLETMLPQASFCGGTDAWFAQLNASRAGLDEADCVAYSITPQVHSFDEGSLVESLSAQADTVVTALAFGDGLDVVVSPVTLRPRFNPDAEDAEPAPTDELPPQVDPRQPTLLCAAWTVGSLRNLVQAGAASITYYETTGWRGVVETESGSPMPARFRSSPGMVFPVYHVLADVCESREARILPTHSSEPLAAEAIAFERGNTIVVLVSSLVPKPQEIVLDGLPASTVGRSRRLWEKTAPAAMSDPKTFRRTSEALTRDGPALTLRLEPYEVIRLDLGEPPPQDADRAASEASRS
jgi:D-apionolactonase